MSKPDEIPQDVWDAAGQAKLSVHSHEAIARAILIERERCAKVAEDYDGPGLEYGMDYQLGDANRTMYDIANAIRGDEK